MNEPVTSTKADSQNVQESSDQPAMMSLARLYKNTVEKQNKNSGCFSACLDLAKKTLPKFAKI